jgi:hypothetical protein
VVRDLRELACASCRHLNPQLENRDLIHPGDRILLG